MERVREKETYFKELPRMIAEAAKSKICRKAEKTGDPGKNRCAVQVPK